MIAPDLATLLCFIFTDANIARNALKKALREATDNSFNRITVDGCMSTNDSVILLANAAAGNRLISGGKDLQAFAQVLQAVCQYLAILVVHDAEGATKFIRINVKGAATEKEAKGIALSIANSALVKTAAFASSANIKGRIVAACGASSAKIDESALKIKYLPLHKKDIAIKVSVGRGKGSAVIYTSDLSYEYVKINAEYN
jgi:glutamate N-acetyltransferase/amino-acid N-acetyltransferase